MEGESVILSCGSRLQKGSLGKSWFASIEERKIAGTMYRQLDIIKKLFGQRAVLIRGGRYYSGRPERIDQTFDIKLHNISRYIAGRYKCIVVSLISKRAVYAESTDHIITVKCKVFLTWFDSLPIFFYFFGYSRLKIVPFDSVVSELVRRIERNKEWQGYFVLN